MFNDINKVINKENNEALMWILKGLFKSELDFNIWKDHGGMIELILIKNVFDNNAINLIYRKNNSEEFGKYEHYIKLKEATSFKEYVKSAYDFIGGNTHLRFMGEILNLTMKDEENSEMAINNKNILNEMLDSKKNWQLDSKYFDYIENVPNNIERKDFLSVEDVMSVTHSEKCIKIEELFEGIISKMVTYSKVPAYLSDSFDSISEKVER